MGRQVCLTMPSELRLLFLVVTLSIAFAPILSYETPELNWFAHKK